MVIKEGYKQSEIGDIPMDWAVKTMGEIAVIHDGTHQTPNYVDYGVPFYSVESVTNNNFSNTKFITEDAHNILTKSFKIEKGDILMTRIGSIGDCKLVDWDVNASFYVSLALLKIKSDYSASYIAHYSKSASFQKETDINSLQSAIPRKINLGPISNIRVLIPTLTEQTAIATALSDVDGLITGLEKLIAKKRNIKQGAMQQLLQPKESWELKKLGEVSDLITKGTTPTSVGREFQNKGINFIKIESLQKNGEIVKDKVAYIDKFTHDLLQRSQLKSKDILFSIAGALGRVAIVKDEILPANTNQALAIIRLKDGYLVDYVYYYLNNEKIQKYILTISVQGAQANLSLLNISELDIPFPTLEEQTRIATILSDMDAELSALEQKLEKYKKVKLGMMQELLTGKTRLN